MTSMQVGEPEQLFPRIEVEEEKPAQAPKAPQKQPKEKAAGKEAAAALGEVTIEDFGKIHLRVVRVLSAEKVEGTEKLMPASGR